MAKGKKATRKAPQGRQHQQRGTLTAEAYGDGIDSLPQLNRVYSAALGDLLNGSFSNRDVSNVTQVGSSMLRNCEFQMKWGTASSKRQERLLDPIVMPSAK